MPWTDTHEPLVHFFFTINPYSIVKEAWPQGPTLEAIVRLLPPLVLAGLARFAAWMGALGDRFAGGIGGADRDRTDDPLLAKQMLSQLSYSPGRYRLRRNVEW